MEDFSFLRLKQTFAEAKSDFMADSEFFYNGGICLNPKENYLQTTNADFNIAFDESYKVELINCKGEVLKNITENVFIHEFQDNNGVYQISFEILPINEDFYFQHLYLKFTHTTSELVCYSNGFYLTAENEKDTFRLDYKSYRNYKGTNYVLADYYQSIRLFGYFNGISEKKDTKVYTEVNGRLRKSRVIQSFEYAYNIDYIDTFTFERLAIALENDLVYINGFKAEVIETLTAGERIAKTNLFDCNFKTQLDKSEIYTDDFQIADPFRYFSLSPLSVFTDSPTAGSISFNYPIIGGSNIIKLYNYDTDVLIANINTILTTNKKADFTLSSLAIGKYYFLFDSNAFLSNFGEVSIANKDIWSFEIASGEFDGTEFDNNEFLTN